MKKVSVTDRHTYDGKVMSEREMEIYEAGEKEGSPDVYVFMCVFGIGIWLSIMISFFIVSHFKN